MFFQKAKILEKKMLSENFDRKIQSENFERKKLKRKFKAEIRLWISQICKNNFWIVSNNSKFQYVFFYFHGFLKLQNKGYKIR